MRASYHPPHAFLSSSSLESMHCYPKQHPTHLNEAAAACSGLCARAAATAERCRPHQQTQHHVHFRDNARQICVLVVRQGHWIACVQVPGALHYTGQHKMQVPVHAQTCMLCHCPDALIPKLTSVFFVSLSSTACILEDCLEVCSSDIEPAANHLTTDIGNQNCQHAGAAAWRLPWRLLAGPLRRPSVHCLQSITTDTAHVA